MALVVESGSGGVPGANSYVSLQDIRTFADDRAIDIEAVEDNRLSAYAIRAMDWLEAREMRFLGSRTSADQPLSWPRSGAILPHREIPDDEIPTNLKSAQCQLVCDIAAGLDLMPNQTNAPVVTREKVDVIEVEYAAGSGGVVPTPTAALALLKPLEQSGFGFNLLRV